MRLTNHDSHKFFSVIVCFFVAQLAPHSQVAANSMQQLVESSARRLVIAEQVVLAKWDSGAAVEDSAREAQVIANATKAGEAMGLDREEVANFFRAQIEANKLVQYALLAEWRRAGKAPAHKPVDLKETTRPELDQLETQMLAELAKTKAVRESASCSTKVAQEVGEYVSANKGKLSEVEAVALDRAMAQTCGRANR
jgi:chorismate mutase